MRNFKQIAGLLGKEEIDALSEPSIMDEHIKRTDPDQYDDIQMARMYKGIPDSFDIGPAGMALGTIKKTGKPVLNVLEGMAGKMQKAPSDMGTEQEIIRRLRADSNLTPMDKKMAVKSRFSVVDDLRNPKAHDRDYGMDQVERLREQGFGDEEINQLLSKYDFTID